MLSRLFWTLMNRLSEWRARERAIAELSALDDRSLADLGISRSDIPYVTLRAPEPVAPRAIPAQTLRHAA